ncbi:AI-2E family transporter [Microlunatus capsulatus]|uniref:PurR-regulated permease PerM n=1 Tax=Microlunatus capsulatus TaxID=99117 RepID=A0ABS4Z5K3_9ACTN|nr:AI-2E family transporter [Microlunatus capsulatus]MBP2416311.1 putative PurR-regulated permease PerM [Microlunatus capsulatus]
MPSTALGDPRRPVPVRTILATIGLVLATALTLLLLYEVRRTLVWVVVAVFFTIALYPVTNWVERHLTWFHRTLATLLVFLVVLALVGGLVTLFAVPLAREGADFAVRLPDLVADARAGRGPVGDLLERTHALGYLQENQERISGFVTGLTTPAAGLLREVATGVAGVVTVFVLALLMVLEGPKVVDGTLTSSTARGSASGCAGWRATARSRSPATSPATC